MTILVVDDEPIVLRLTSTVLENAGHKVLLASSAEDALRICSEAKSELDLVISDVSMKGMGGRELATCLAEGPHPIPVLLMSGHPQSSPLVERMIAEGRLGRCRFIEKPFHPRDLLRQISLAATDTTAN